MVDNKKYYCYNLTRGDIMKEVIIETLIDSLKLIPFLFVAFLIIEVIEHKFSKKEKKDIQKSGKKNFCIRKESSTKVDCHELLWRLILY